MKVQCSVARQQEPTRNPIEPDIGFVSLFSEWQIGVMAYQSKMDWESASGCQRWSPVKLSPNFWMP
jgi:hypothetical protein